MPRDKQLELSLLLIRISVAAFLLVWALDKMLVPEHAAAVFGKYYMIRGLPSGAMTALGIAQVALIAAFAGGLARTWTYGVVFVMHAVSTFSTMPHLINPFAEGRQILFWTGVPVLAAIAALFVLRERDRMLSIDSARSQ